MVSKRNKNILGISLAILILGFLIYIIFFVSPDELVETLGVHNAYLIMFFVALFGGFSTGGSISFMTVLVTFILGGLNPIYIALISGVALFIGDLVMFYLGSKGRELIKGKWDKKIQRVKKVVYKHKILKKNISVLAYLYIAFTPLPNDIILLFMAAIEYPMKKMKWIIIAGDLTFAFTISILTAKGILFFI